MKAKEAFKQEVTLRYKELKSGKHSYYLDIYDKGVRSYKFLGLHFNPNNRTERSLAKKKATKVQAEYKYKLLNGELHSNSCTNTTDFIEYFREYVESKGNKETRANYLATLHHLEKFTGGKVLFKDITKQWLQGLQDYLILHLSHNTVYKIIKHVSSVLAQAVRDEVILKNPASDFKIAVNPVLKSYLTVDELEQLSISECRSNIVKLAFLFACNTGLRLGDIQNLKWTDVNMTERKIAITMLKTRETIYLPLNNNSYSILMKLQVDNAEEVVFKLPAKSYMSAIINDWIKEAGITKHITFHSSRHTFAVLGLANGTDIYTVSKLLGHTSVKTTEVYAKIVNKKMEEGVNVLDSIRIMI